MYSWLLCVFFVNVVSSTSNPPESTSEYIAYEDASGTYHNTYNFYYGSGQYTDHLNDDLGLTLSFSQQNAMMTWQNSFDGMSGSARRNAIQSSTPPIQLTITQQCQLLTSYRGFFRAMYAADASVCTSILGASGDATRVGFSSPVGDTGVGDDSGFDDGPTGCSDLGCICPSVTNIATPSLGFTIEGNVAVLIPQLAELGYSQEFLENDCVSEDCTWPSFIYNGFECLCCQTTRGENALVVGLGPSVVVAKVAITKGNCVAKLQPTL